MPAALQGSTFDPFAFTGAQTGSRSFSGPFATQNMNRNTAAIGRAQDVQNQMNAFGAQPGAPGAGAGGGPLNNAAERDQMIMDETFGFRDQVLSDPSQQQALDFLSGVVGGSNQPFNQEVRSSILSGASDQAANSSANQQRNIIASAARQGLNQNDPAVQARLNATLGQQGIAGQQALQSLNQQANIANFGAQSQAANDIARNRLAQMNLAGQFGLTGVNLLANRNIGQEVPGPVQGQGFQQFQPQSQQGSQFNFTTVPRAGGIAPQRNINVPVAGSQGGQFRFDDQGQRHLIGGGQSTPSSTPRIAEVGNAPGFPNGNQISFGEFNQFGNTAIPGSF